MNIPISIFLPVLGGVYGAFVGGYIHSKKRTSGRKLTLWITGILLLLICTAAIVTDCYQ